MLKNELYNIAETVIKEREIKEQEYQEGLILRNYSNTEFVWENYIKKGLIENAKEGKFSRSFHFVKNILEKCYYCVQKTSNIEIYYNSKLHMPYNFPLLKDSFFDLDTLISLIQENNLSYNITSKPMAYSEYSKYYYENAYVILSIYWKDEEIISPEKKRQLPVSSFIKEVMQLPTDPKKISTNQKIQERNKMSAGLRFDVLKRDNYKCQICGRTQKDGVKLHVDHIIPIAKGGKTELDNLQTLCQDCNLGKGIKNM